MHLVRHYFRNVALYDASIMWEKFSSRLPNVHGLELLFLPSIIQFVRLSKEGPNLPGLVNVLKAKVVSRFCLHLYVPVCTSILTT